MVNTQDSVILFSGDLIITEKLAVYTLNFTGFYKLDKVDTSRLNKEFRYKNVSVKDNYFIHTENYSDTLLNLNRDDKVFLYKNRYYLNHFNKGSNELAKEASWSIFQLEKNSENHFSLNLINKEDYKLLFDTTKQWQPIFSVAHLSNKEFKKFVDAGGFRQKIKLVKDIN